MTDIIISPEPAGSLQLSVRLPDYEDAFCALRRIERELRPSNYHDLSGLQRVMKEAQELTAQTDFDAVAADLQARKRPATRNEASRYLATLVGSFPVSKSPSPEVYGRMLLEEVVASRPTIGALVQACSNLRRTSRFVPSISEVITALDAEEKTLSHQLFTLDSFPKELERGRKQMADLIERERVVREERERRLMREDQVLEHGRGTKVAEALARLLQQLGPDEEAPHLAGAVRKAPCPEDGLD